MTGAVIIDRDTFRALGLRYLLDKFFDIHAETVSDPAAVDVGGLSAGALLFVSPELYVAAPDLFMPRKRFTVLISSLPCGDMQSVDSLMDESSLIDRLKGIIEEWKETADTGVPGAELSQREIDVLRLVAMGYINKEIADTLSISINTVLSHRKNITAKLGIRSASGLGFYAVMNGIVDASDPRR